MASAVLVRAAGARPVRQCREKDDCAATIPLRRDDPADQAWRQRLSLQCDEVENLDQEEQDEEDHEEAAPDDADVSDVTSDVHVLLRGTRGQEAGRLCSSRSGSHRRLNGTGSIAPACPAIDRDLRGIGRNQGLRCCSGIGTDCVCRADAGRRTLRSSRGSHLAGPGRGS